MHEYIIKVTVILTTTVKLLNAYYINPPYQFAPQIMMMLTLALMIKKENANHEDNDNYNKKNE